MGLLWLKTIIPKLEKPQARHECLNISKITESCELHIVQENIMALESQKQNKNYRQAPDNFGGNNVPAANKKPQELNFAPDTFFIFTVFLVLSSGLWQAISFKLGFMAQSDVNIMKLLVQSAFCALCFVPIAVYWERVRHLFVPLFPVFLAMLMVTSSSIWSGEHANSTRDSFVLFLMFCAALGMVLHFRSYKLIALMTITLVTSLLLQFMAQAIAGNLANLSFNDSELALCFSLSIMLVTYNRPSKILWFMIATMVLLVGIIINDMQIYIVAIISIIVAIMHRLSFGIKDRNFFLASHFVNILGLVTVLVLFYGGDRLGQVWYILSQMDTNSLIGAGFLGDGQSILKSFVEGLGLIGFLLGLLFISYIIGGLLVKNNTGVGVKMFEFSLIAIILGNSGGISTFSLPMLALFIAVCLNIMPSSQNRVI